MSQMHRIMCMVDMKMTVENSEWTLLYACLLRKQRNELKCATVCMFIVCL